jgi:hypothetical protein
MLHASQNGNIVSLLRYCFNIEHASSLLMHCVMAKAIRSSSAEHDATTAFFSSIDNRHEL